jgi:hypothetical protein
MAKVMQVKAPNGHNILLYVSISVFSVAVLNWLQSIIRKLPEMWFYVDEWWVIRRVTSNSMEYLVPFNEHLSLIPLLIYKIIARMFTMDSYTPYFIAMLLPLVLSCLFFGLVSKKIFKVPAWIIILLSPLYLINGAGAPSLVWAFQVGVTLQALFFSLVIALSMLVHEKNHKVMFAKYSTISFILALSALTSGAYPFVLLIFILVNIGRLVHKLIIVVCAPSLIIFLTWYVTYGVKYPGPKYGILDNPGLIQEFPKFFFGMVLFSVNSYSPSTYLNILYLLLFVGAFLSRNKEIRRITLACISVELIFAFITSWNRVSLGFPLTGSGHYQYLQSAFLFIPVTVSLGMLLNKTTLSTKALRYLTPTICLVLVLNLYISGVKYNSIINWRSQVDSSIKEDFSKACQGTLPVGEIGQRASKFGFNIYPGQIDEQLIASLRGNVLFSSSCKSNK